MQDGQDQYSKVYSFALGGDNQGVNAWYHAATVQSRSEAKALLVTNTAVAGVSFNAYSYGAQLAGLTNYIFFSENIRTGLTSGSSSQGWFSYDRPSQPSPVYSTIQMPDGTTNGVISRVYRPSADADGNNGIYQAFPNAFPQVVRGNVYTVSVWAAVDPAGGYPSTGSFRFSYFNGSVSLFSPNFQLTTTPTRFYWTFVANTGSGSGNVENIAFANGSDATEDMNHVFWGAQMVDGNSPGEYIPTSTNYNGLSSATTTAYGFRSMNGIYQIVSTPIVVGGQRTVMLNTSAFTVGTNNVNGAAPPSGLSVYGLY
jgi:hypothetical protein